MRLEQYINEAMQLRPHPYIIAQMESPRFEDDYNESKKDLLKIAKQLKKDCKSFIQQSKGQTLWGGSRKGPVAFATMKTITPRTDRKPLDTNENLQEVLNDIFYNMFGWKPRSEGVFCTGDLGETREYGQSYSIWPIGNFKFIWSAKINDLYHAMPLFKYEVIKSPKAYRRWIEDKWESMYDMAKDMNVKSSTPDKKEFVDAEFQKQWDADVENIKNKYLNDYIDKDLVKAIKSKNEIMIQCKKYHMISDDTTAWIWRDIYG